MGYVTLDELKASLRIDDTHDDTLLEQAIEAASHTIDDRCDRHFGRIIPVGGVRPPEARYYTPTRLDRVQIDDLAANTALAVSQRANGQWKDIAFEALRLEPEDAPTRDRPYRLLRALQARFPASPNGSATVRVTSGEWGWPEVPKPIRTAALLLASRLFRRHDSPLGVAGIGELGTVYVTRIDPDIDQLIQPYKLNPIGIG